MKNNNMIDIGKPGQCWKTTFVLDENGDQKTITYEYPIAIPFDKEE